MADHVFGGLHCAEVEDLAAPFVLGALEPEEARAVRAHLAACPEAHPAFAELGSVVPALFESVEPMPAPAGLKGRILAAAAAEQRAGMPAPDVAPVSAIPATIDRERMPARRRDAAVEQRGWANLFRRPVWAGVAMAAVLAAVAVSVGYVQLRQQVDDLSAYQRAVAAVLADAAQPGAQLAVLGPTEGTSGPGGFAAIAQDGAVNLVMHDLAPTNGAQVYEAWLIAGNDAPVPIGGFKVGSNGTAAFGVAHPSLGDGVTIALTLEPGPGATVPTTPPVAAGMARA